MERGNFEDEGVDGRTALKSMLNVTGRCKLDSNGHVS